MLLSSPLTQAQMGIYAECMRRLGEPAYNVTNLFRLSHRLNAERLQQAIHVSITAHPALLSQVAEDDAGSPCLTFRALEKGEMLCATLQMEEEGVMPFINHISRPYDLRHDRLLRAFVIDTPTHQYICIATHHLVFDGLSRQTLFRDIDTAYRKGRVEGETVTCFDVAAREIALRHQSEEMNAARDWYLHTFGEVEGPTTPDPDVTASGALTYGEQHRYLSLSRQEFLDLCEQLRTSPSSVAYAAFGRLLSVYTGRRDAAFATIWHGRHNADTERTVMMMVRTLPVYCQYDAQTSLSDYVKGVGEQVSEARKRDVYSFADLSAETGFSSDVLFAYHGTIRNVCAIAEAQLEQVNVGKNETGAPLALSVMLEGERIALLTEYHRNRYSDEYIARFTDALDAIFCHMAADPRGLVSRLSLVSQSQETKLRLFHRTATMDVPVQTFHGGIERWASETPDAIAVVAKDQTLNYRQFDGAANRVAHALLNNGLQRGDRVVLLLPRTSRFLVAAYAVMKCGAAYIPMDPAYPTDRIAYILSDSGGRFVVTTTDHVGEYPHGGLDIDILWQQAAQCPTTPPHIQVDAHDLAYIIYTSGSTGKPKGVMLEHLGVANFFTPHPVNQLVRACTDYATVTLCQTTLSFDLSIYEYGTPLFNGCTVVLASEDECMDPIAQAILCQRTGVECISGTPSRIAMNMELDAYNHLIGTQIKAIMTGGEKLPWSLVERLRERNVILINGYGPTETTMGSSAGVMNKARYVHVGRPCANYTYRILDRDHNELPVGVVGELAIGGVGLARGYNNLPEKTAAAFIQWQGERLYLTGDYARWDDEGNVIILGRTDHQVKLNGLRIELGEIETVLSHQPGIRQGVVVIKKVGGQDRLVAYYTTHVEQEPSVEELQRGMSAQLTPYMVPGIFVRLDKMPITPAGKTDIKHLPDPIAKRAEIVAPANEQEQAMFDLCHEILGDVEFGVTTPLLSVGLTSLLSIRLSMLIKKRMNVVLKVADIMEVSTIRGILKLISNLGTGKAETTAPQIFRQNQPRPRTPFPLTFAQVGVYLDCLRNPNTTLYNTPVLLHFPSSVKAEHLKAAVLRVLSLHPSLFCRIVDLVGEPMMLYPERLELDVPIENMTSSDLAQFKQTAVLPFFLSQAPLCRAKIITTEVSTYLFLDIHHLVSDGSSMAIIRQQLCDFLNGQQVEGEKYTFFDYADKQHAWMQSSDFLKNLEYFDYTLRDFQSCTEIPTDYQAQKIGHLQEASLSIAHYMDNIETFCQQESLTPAQFWYAAICYVLSRHAGTRDVYLCSISSGRQNLDITDTVGMFVNTLALHTSIGKYSVLDYVKSAAKAYANAMEHEEFPFSQIADKYGFRPKFNYVYQLGLMSECLVDGQAIKMEGLETKVPKFPISVSIEYVKDEPCVLVQYDDALYAEGTMKRMIDSVVNVAQQIFTSPESPIRHLSLISDAQERELNSFRQVATMDLPVKTFHQGIERWAEQTPNARAVVATDCTLTYQQLDEIANRLANALLSKGLRQGDRVVLLLPRTSKFLVSAFAVMKCGAAYIPMDPAYPTDRIAYILSDSNSRFVLTTTDHVADYSERAIDIEELYRKAEQCPSTRPDIQVDAHDLAYIIYTSGSTGKPKGVMLEHLGVANFFTTNPVNELVRICTEYAKVILCQTTLSFDLSIFEYGTPLFNGSTVVLANEEECMDPIAQAELCQRAGVECVSGTPSRIAMNMELDAYNHLIGTQIKAIMTGGEKLPWSLVERLRERNVILINGYGPTETTMGSSAGVMNKARYVHVGRPCANYTYRILDRDHNELPVGVVGELAIGGVGLARGYNNLPEKTAAAFIQWQSERLYLTGDYARWDDEGNVIILGRTDHQVKLNGLRIELGEIETVLSHQPGIRQGVVVIKKVGGQDRLVAYYTATKKSIDQDALKAGMSEHLTPYMVPDIFIQMDEFPLSPAGKIDPKKLPEPQTSKRTLDVCRNETEQRFCNVFARILGTQDISPTDNFFEIGGTSLLAVRVVIEATNEGFKIDYKTIFDHPTPRMLAQLTTPTTSTDTPQKQPEIAPPPMVPPTQAINSLDALLAGNTLQAFLQGERQPIGGAIVTGATGYLGLHIVKELIDLSDHLPIYCLVRSNRVQSAVSRMRALLFYYFDDSYDELIGKRLFIIDGDITKPESFDQLPTHADGITHLFNCAANVKHFSAGTDIEDVNLGGALNCINFCVKADILMIQTSTHSIAGTTVSDTPINGREIHETELYWGQTLDNQYIRAKFEAEQAVLQAMQERGLNAKIMRLGNLSARSTDGEFQVNFSTNSFMGRLRAYQAVGSISYEEMSTTIEFSPINEVAHAILLLSQTPQANSIFHPVNTHIQPLAGVINCLNKLGIPIQLVEQEEFKQQLLTAAANPSKTAILQSMLAYDTVAEGKYVVFNGVNNLFTTQILMRMGFQWSFTTWDYIQQFITAIKGLGFFDEEYSRE